MRRPHTIHVFDTDEVYSGERPRQVDTLDWSYIGFCPALVAPEKANTIFNDWDVTLIDPYIVFVDIGFLHALKQGNIFYWDALWMIVETEPRPYKAGIQYKYATFAASRIRFQGLKIPTQPSAIIQRTQGTTQEMGNRPTFSTSSGEGIPI